MAQKICQNEPNSWHYIIPQLSAMNLLCAGPMSTSAPNKKCDTLKITKLTHFFAFPGYFIVFCGIN